MEEHNRTQSLPGILDALLSRAPEAARSYDSIDQWWPVFRDQRAAWSEAIDQALIGGVIADRVGYAFAAGYQAALRRIDPALPLDRMACFSATEEGGGHPRAVQATLLERADGKLVLNGKKKWATMSSHGGIALVVASVGTDPQGRNRLRVARVDLDSPGVRVIAMPPTPFSPEVPHRRLELVEVVLDQESVLAGDGYEDYVKPFRTLEDLHVGAAILAYVFAVAARYRWPRPEREQLLQLLVSLRALALADASSAAVQIALEGVFQARHQLLERCAPYWQQVEEPVRERWQRDIALNSIAGNVRAQRAERAWQIVG
ncbi:MAG TPA: acyl-CoA dehydrogenase family protein [Terriglobales bacterium]|nr:acyl-CoA dehydrogenase family protein [Terriglobales bacterium]